jgi:hypothetical protein
VGLDPNLMKLTSVAVRDDMVAVVLEELKNNGNGSLECIDSYVEAKNE